MTWGGGSNLPPTIVFSPWFFLETLKKKNICELFVMHYKLWQAFDKLVFNYISVFYGWADLPPPTPLCYSGSPDQLGLTEPIFSEYSQTQLSRGCSTNTLVSNSFGHIFPPNLQDIIIPRLLELESLNFERIFIPYYVSHVTSHVAHVMRQMSHGTCHVAHVMCHMSGIICQVLRVGAGCFFF